MADLETALGALSADSFTEETPTGKEEIRFTAYLSNANFPKVEVVLYRYDGEYCLATVDGRTVSLIPRSQTVALMEAVNAIVLKRQETMKSMQTVLKFACSYTFYFSC